MINQLSERFSLPLKPAYNATRGFFIQMQHCEENFSTETLPSYFIKAVKTKSSVSFTTEDLVSNTGLIIVQIKRVL